MKKFLLAAAALLAIAAPAFAADLPATKAPPVTIPIYDWSGFYLGINGGGGSSRNCFDIIDALGVPVPAGAAREGCHDATGGTAGGQIGYRWQNFKWVVGIEAQGNWADFKGSNTSLLLAPLVNRSTIDAFGLFTGQVGYTANNLLFYMKGGAAVVDSKFETFVPGAAVVFNDARQTNWGGTIGLGLEWGFMQNWSVAAEYDHLFLGDHPARFATLAGAIPRTDRITQDIDVGLVRVNYRWGGPVIAKY